MQKILFYDFETFPNISYHWQGKYEQNIIEIIEEGYVLCMGYKWKGEKKSHIISLPDCNWDKKKLAIAIHKIINEADVKIAHNGNKFDSKWANRDFITYKLNPPKPSKNIDTLSIARSKFNFNSNSLKDLAILLGLRPKIETGGFPLWKGYVKKEKKCINKMHKYCKNDVDLLELIYERLSPWMNNYPTEEVGMFCHKCHGKVQFRGPYTNKTYIYKRYQCQKCGSWCLSNRKLKIDLDEYIK